MSDVNLSLSMIVGGFGSLFTLHKFNRFEFDMTRKLNDHEVSFLYLQISGGSSYLEFELPMGKKNARGKSKRHRF